MVVLGGVCRRPRPEGWEKGGVMLWPSELLPPPFPSAETYECLTVLVDGLSKKVPQC